MLRQHLDAITISRKSEGAMQLGFQHDMESYNQITMLFKFKYP